MTYRDLAEGFIQAAHYGQVRKYTGENYVVHLLEVEELVYNILSYDLRVAALLHDVLEDTKIGEEYLRSIFKKEDVDIVKLLTDKPLSFGNRATRKADTIARLSKAGFEAQTIKYADIISNARSIRNYDTKFWPIYQKESLTLLDTMKDGDLLLRVKAVEECE